MTFDMPITAAAITGPTTFNLSWVTRIPRMKVDIDRIMDAVGKEFSVSRDQLVGRRKQAHVAWARQAAMAIAYETEVYSSDYIGERFGLRDHATVLYAARCVRDRCQTDKRCREQVQRVKEMLNALP